MRVVKVSAVSLVLLWSMLGAAASNAHADTLYFDYSSAPSTTWDQGVTANWGTEDYGPFENVWVDGSDARFVNTAGIVTVSGTIDSVNSITFASGLPTNGTSPSLSGGTLSLTGSGAITNSSNYERIISSTIAGNVGLTKSGAAKVSIWANNTYSGDTMVTQGTLRVGGNTATGTLGTGGAVLGSGTLLEWFRSGESTLSNVISGAGTLAVVGAGATTLTGANTNTGGLNMNTAKIRIGVDSVGTPSAIISSAVGKGAISLSYTSANTAITSDSTTPRTILNQVLFAANTVNVGLGDATRSGKLTFQGQATLIGVSPTLNVNSEVEYAGAIVSSTAQGITKGGSATLTLSGLNTYTGPTNVNVGTLSLARSAGGAVLSSSSAISVAAGATLGVQPGGEAAISAGSDLTLNGGDTSAAAFTMVDNAISSFATGGLTTTTGTVLPTLTFEIGNSLGSIDAMSLGATTPTIASGTLVDFVALSGATSLETGDYTFMTAGGGLGAGALALADNSIVVGGTTYNLSLANSTDTAAILNVSSVPEPGTLALLVTGLVGLLAYAWRKRK